MAGESNAEDLPGLDQLLSDKGVAVPSIINRAVLVGTSRGPQDVIQLERWERDSGLLEGGAFQLGGKDAFNLIAENDANGMAPGSNLLQIFKQYAPS